MPAHKFQQEPFFERTIFHRSWLSLFTDTSYRLSARLMNALWNCRAGDLRHLRHMLERPHYYGGLPAEAFFHACEESQIMETKQKERDTDFELHEEEIEKAAKIMFGDLLTERPHRLLQHCMEIKADADRERKQMNRYCDSREQELERIKEAMHTLEVSRKRAVARADESERLLGELRAFKEKMFSLERENQRLHMEQQAGSASKDMRIARYLKDRYECENEMHHMEEALKIAALDLAMRDATIAELQEDIRRIQTEPADVTLYEQATSLFDLLPKALEGVGFSSHLSKPDSGVARRPASLI